MTQSVAQAVQMQARGRQESAWEVSRQQILCHALRMGNGPVFDFRRLLTDARSLDMAGRLIWQIIRPLAPEVLVGPGYGAAPLPASVVLAALADEVALSYLMVRDRRKAHHQKRWVEGRPVRPGARAVIIDDFMEGGSNGRWRPTAMTSISGPSSFSSTCGSLLARGSCCWGGARCCRYIGGMISACRGIASTPGR